jgi:serine protease Do
MDERKFKDVYDLKWRNSYDKADYKIEYEVQSGNAESFGQIKFRRSRKRSAMKGFVKSMALVLVASVSGAAAGVYVIERKYAQVTPSNVYTYPSSYNPTGSSLPKNSITRVAEIVGPAVVGISNNAENFLGRVVNQSTGSGIIISQDGYIVTNQHVIEGANRIAVKLSGVETKPLNAVLIGVDKTSDIAVIKIDMKNLPTAKFGDSSKIRVGDTAIAIGNPLGEEFAGSVTQGIISATNRRIEVVDPYTKETTIYKVLQTDAAINPGNSGGPLCNELGEIIGINSIKMGYNQNVEGIGFAISSNEIVNVVNEILSSGKVSRPDLGVVGSYYEDRGITGYYVRQVFSGAAEAGIIPTDIILQIDGDSISKAGQLSQIIEKYKVGDTIICKVLRDEKKYDIKVVLKEKSN